MTTNAVPTDSGTTRATTTATASKKRGVVKRKTRPDTVQAFAWFLNERFEKKRSVYLEYAGTTTAIAINYAVDDFTLVRAINNFGPVDSGAQCSPALSARSIAKSVALCGIDVSR